MTSCCWAASGQRCEASAAAVVCCWAAASSGGRGARGRRCGALALVRSWASSGGGGAGGRCCEASAVVCGWHGDLVARGVCLAPRWFWKSLGQPKLLEAWTPHTSPHLHAPQVTRRHKMAWRAPSFAWYAIEPPILVIIIRWPGSRRTPLRNPLKGINGRCSNRPQELPVTSGMINPASLNM